MNKHTLEYFLWRDFVSQVHKILGFSENSPQTGEGTSECLWNIKFVKHFGLHYDKQYFTIEWSPNLDRIIRVSNNERTVSFLKAIQQVFEEYGTDSKLTLKF